MSAPPRAGSWLLPLVMAGGTLACASQPEPVVARTHHEEPQEIDSPSETVAAPITELTREQVDATVDAKLPVFLQKVEVAAILVDGKFRGWRIVRFTQPDEWRGVGLLPGDVVQTINGQPIEREGQAYAVFVSLKTAKSLDVAYEREGQPMRLSLPIIGEPKPVAAAGKPAEGKPVDAKAEPAKPDASKPAKPK